MEPSYFTSFDGGPFNSNGPADYGENFEYDGPLIYGEEEELSVSDLLFPVYNTEADESSPVMKPYSN
ncbi:hypothetical protein OROMI_008152 [Orobanche minor]